MLVVELAADSANRSTVKIQTTPQTFLFKVRDEACTKLKVDPLDFSLAYKGKPLELTMPQQFTSLVNGARLSLVAAQRPQTVRVKLRLPQDEFTGSFDAKATMADLLRATNATGSIYLGVTALPDSKTLLELGVQSSVVLRVGPKERPAEPAVPDTPKPAEPTQHPPAQNTQTREAVRVQTAPGTPQTDTPSSSSEMEPSVAQSRVYMEHLRSQAEPRPMMFRSTQQRLKNERRRQQDLRIRVRFPDMSALEGVFKPQEMGAHVFDFVRRYLIDSSLAFSLETVPPGFHLEEHHNLVDDTPFDARVMLALKTSAKGPYLNDAAKAVASAGAGAGASAGADGPSSGPSNGPSSGPGSDTKPKHNVLKRPKWLKLGK